MSSTGNIPSVPNNYGSQEGTQLSPGGDFNGQQNQQWQQPGQGQGRDWQQRDQSQQWQQRDRSQQWQDRDNNSQQWQDRDGSQQLQQPGQDQDWHRRGSQAGGTNDANDGNFRPMNVQPAREGGVAIDGREGLPQGKASLTDKLMGKAEKVTGKLTKNPEKHERGELREAGGKGAERGEARASHD